MEYKKRRGIIGVILALFIIGAVSALYSPVYYKLNIEYENNRLNVKRSSS